MAAYADGVSFLVLGVDEATAARGLPAVLLPASPALPDAHGMLERLLEYRMRLDAWSESVLASMARDAPLQEVFDAVAGMFANPLMLSDSSLYFVLTAGRLPDGFHDPFWTPAMETGVCPSELYFSTWMRSSDDAFCATRAYLVANEGGQGRTYLVRNLAVDGEYHGCFELVDANAPLRARRPRACGLRRRPVGAHHCHDQGRIPRSLMRRAGPFQRAAGRQRRCGRTCWNAGWPKAGLEPARCPLRRAFHGAAKGADEHAGAHLPGGERRIAEVYPRARFVEDGDAATS